MKEGEREREKSTYQKKIHKWELEIKLHTLEARSNDWIFNDS